MKTPAFKEGAAAQKQGLRLTDNPYKQGITEEGVAAYCDWLDGFIESKLPGVLKEPQK